MGARYRYLLLVCLLLVSDVLLPVRAAMAHGSLTIATEGDVPPFNYVNDQGVLTGFDIEIAQAICQEIAADCTFVTRPATTLFQGLSRGEFDLIVSSMSKDVTSDDALLMTKSYYRSYAAFIADPARFTTRLPADRQDIRIASTHSPVQVGYLRRHYGHTQLVLVDSQPAAFAALKEGRADVVMGDAISLLAFLQSPQGQGFDFLDEPEPDQSLRTAAHMTVAAGKEALVEEINQALATLHLNGTYDRISRKYFPFSVF